MVSKGVSMAEEFEVYEEGGKYHWKLQAANNEVVADSGFDLGGTHRPVSVVRGTRPRKGGRIRHALVGQLARKHPV